MRHDEIHDLLLIAAAYNPTAMPKSDEKAALKIAVWSEALSDVSFDRAVESVHRFYRKVEQTDTLTPALVRHLASSGSGGFVEKFTNCNPIIVAPTGDTDGRYEVWCRRCGPEAATFHESWPEARRTADTHRATPNVESRDWSEPEGVRA